MVVFVEPGEPTNLLADEPVGPVSVPVAGPYKGFGGESTCIRQQAADNGSTRGWAGRTGASAA